MHMYDKPNGLLDLPPELLFEVLAYSASPNLPLANKYLLYTFKHATPSCRAHFILNRLDELFPLIPTSQVRTILEHALSYPICTTAVLDVLERISPLVVLSPATLRTIHVSPGRWLFRNLYAHSKPKRRRKPGPLSNPNLTSGAPSSLSTTSPRTNPLPFLESLASRYTLSFSTQGSAFALSTCVRAGPAQYPLLQFLLRNGADPGAQSCLPLQIAATLGDIHALKLMIEPSEEVQDGEVKGGKRRRVEDRVQPTTKVLLAAVKAKRIGVAEWLMREKGVVPDMATMQMLQNA